MSKYLQYLKVKDTDIPAGKKGKKKPEPVQQPPIQEEEEEEEEEYVPEPPVKKAKPKPAPRAKKVQVQEQVTEQEQVMEQMGHGEEVQGVQCPRCKGLGYLSKGMPKQKRQPSEWNLFVNQVHARLKQYYPDMAYSESVKVASNLRQLEDSDIEKFFTKPLK